MKENRGGGRVDARRSLGPASGAREGTDFSKAGILEVLLVIAKLPSDTGVIAECNDSVDTLTRVRPSLDRRNAFAENLGVKVLVLLQPSACLLGRAPIGGARLVLVGQQPESSSGSGAMAGKAEDDGRLIGAIEGGEEVPTRIGNDLRHFDGNTRARG